MCNVHHTLNAYKVNFAFNIYRYQTCRLSISHSCSFIPKQRALVSFNLLEQHAYCFSMALRTARVNSWVVALPPMSRVLCEPSAITS